MTALHLILATLVLLSLACLNFFFSVNILQLTALIQLILLPVLFITLFLPSSQQRLPGEVLRPWRLWGRIVLLQLLFYLLLFSLAVPLLTLVQPIMDASQRTNLYMISWVASFFGQGLHPWCWVAVLVVVLGKSAPPSAGAKLSHLQSAVSKNVWHPTLLSAIDLVAMMANFILIMLFAGATVLNGLALLQHVFPWVRPTPYTAQMIFPLIVAAVLLSSKNYQSRLQKQTKRQKSFVGVLVRVMLFVGLLVASFQFLVNTLDLEQQTLLHKERIFLPLSVEAARSLWLLIYWSVNLLAAPLLAGYLARLCQGLRIRQILLMILLFPLALMIAFTQLDYALAQHITNIFQHFFAHEPIAMAILLGTQLCLWLILRQDVTFNQTLVEMTSNLAGKNMRRFRRLTIRQSPLLVYLLLLGLIFGLYGLEFVLMILALSVLLICFICLFAFFKKKSL